MNWFLLFVLGIAGNPAITIPDIAGAERQPLRVASGHVEALFFVDQTCPVSNYYSHEIRRICEDYAARGAGCALVYVDPTLSNEEAGKHAARYGHGDYPKIVDRKHALVKATGAAITPEAVIVKPGGEIAYRGRIDDYYADFGKPRQQVTEHDVRDALDAVLTGKPVAKAETKPVGCYIPALKFYGK
jgi:hypothetical protein